jgi:chemotaxis protein CheX
MSATRGAAPPLITDLIDEETVQGIADETWMALLGIDEVLVPVPAEVSEDAVSAWVEVTGPWTGAVVVTCGRATAEELSRTLLREPADEPIDHADVADALGELANVVGGNIKALLPAPSVLGLPGVGGKPPRASSVDTCTIGLLWRGQPVTVSVRGAERTGAAPHDAEEDVAQ